jgi:uncharacterized membrane protein YfcA
LSWTELITLGILGLGAGTLGGLLGIGGSIVMIPVLTLVLGYDQHLSQASAMIVNVFIAAPALFRHVRQKAVEWTAVIRLIPAGLLAIIVGVEASNQLDGEVLMRIFGAFLIYVIYDNVRKLISGRRLRGDGEGHLTWTRCSAVGAIMGFAAGLLGIGGGILAVPLLQRLCRMRLVRCIPVSSAAMCVTATLGAIRKNMVIGDLTDASGVVLDPWDSVMIAGCLVPTAILGGLFGAGLTHSLPRQWVRLALTILLCGASAKFLGMF